MNAPTPSDEPVLDIRGLTVRYGTATVLRDVDLQVRQGQVISLLGANGAGKTTLMRAAAGLVPSSAGSVVLNGAPVDKAKPHQRAQRGLCLIPEGRGIFPNLTVRENLRLQGSPKERRQTLERIISAFPVLGEKLAQRAGSLSGGQQQMMALGRSLVSNPSVVLLDEVSMGLAPLVVDQIFEALEGLAATGVSLLLVEQYVSKALSMADHIYVLDRGSVNWAGSPTDITEEEIMERYLALEVASRG
jgi:branched-chain amino acid transport system ATP-binding protein